MNQEEREKIALQLGKLIVQYDHKAIVLLLSNIPPEDLHLILNEDFYSLKEHENCIGILLAAERTSVDLLHLLVSLGAKINKPDAFDSVVGSIILEAMCKKYGANFNPTFITDLNDDKNKLSFKQYLCKLKCNIVNNYIVTNKTFIISFGGHWSCCQIRCHINDGTPELKLFFLDPTGQRSDHEEIQNEILDIAKKVFHGSIVTYISTRKLQRDGYSCQIFSLMFARMIYSLFCGKFHEVYPNYDLFTDLESISSKTEVIMNGRTFIVLSDIPAKFQQADQFYKNNGYIAVDTSRAVKSSGQVLQTSFDIYVEQKNRENGTILFFNNKIIEQYNKFCRIFHEYMEINKPTVAMINNIVNRYSLDGMIIYQEKQKATYCDFDLAPI